MAEHIQQAIAGLSPPAFHPIEGVAGYQFFDQDGDSPRPFSVGVYRNKKIISAPTQIQTVPYPEEIPDLQKALEAEQILFLGVFLITTNSGSSGNVNDRFIQSCTPNKFLSRQSRLNK